MTFEKGSYVDLLMLESTWIRIKPELQNAGFQLTTGRPEERKDGSYWLIEVPPHEFGPVSRMLEEKKIPYMHRDMRTGEHWKNWP
jgi:hypothetical protein